MLPENFSPTPAEQLETRRVVDHRLTTEGLILSGLADAVHKNWITEDEKSEWLNNYITRRNEGQIPASDIQV